jgi:hypothetical protein
MNLPKLTWNANSAAQFQSLRQLKRQAERSMNTNELAELLIGAAIVHGFDSGIRITGTLHNLR